VRANTERRAVRRLEARQELHAEAHPAGWYDCQGQVAHTGGVERSEVRVGGAPVKAHREGKWWILDKDLSGTVMIEER
jgi:hypothetical protein